MPTDLDTQIVEWRKSLLDTTKRNRLIKFVAGRIGGVSLVRPTANDLWRRLVRDGEELIVRENESIYLPLGCEHRLTNPGRIPLTLIEVQSGSYLGADDIVRIEDEYGRI